MNENKESMPISRFVEVNKALIHALDWGGSGTPLLLVHGAMRTGRSWNAVARRLKDTYRVISVDIRGHGDSGATVDGNDTSSRMKDILAILKICGNRALKAWKMSINATQLIRK